jgi:NADPH:quinone reductase-like Zn-dependent oxidoreductase
MSRAVKFSRYGPEVLDVVDVQRPTPGAGEVVVRVVTAALNPGEIGIREGVFANIWTANFPEGQGNDFAGYVDELGPGVTGIAVGDEVIGYSPRRAQAEYVALPITAVARKPAELSWEQAAAIAAQLALLKGARVIGTASSDNFGFLRELGVVPVAYGPGLVDRLRDAAPEGIDALIDTFGQGNVEAALQLGVNPDRINTLADGRAVQLYGVHSQAQEEAASPAIWEQLAVRAARGEFAIPIEQVYPLAEVRAAYRDVASRHVRGKRILAIAEPRRS